VQAALAARGRLPEQGLLVAAGDGGYAVSPEGEAMAERLIAERRASLARMLDGWAPEQEAELATLLTRFASELAGEPGPELAGAGATSAGMAGSAA
jgi:hypothetical protein